MFSQKKISEAKYGKTIKYNKILFLIYNMISVLEHYHTHKMISVFK